MTKKSRGNIPGYTFPVFELCLTNEYIMKVNFINGKAADVRYESPAAEAIEIESEGVLCASGQNEEWNEETLGQ